MIQSTLAQQTPSAGLIGFLPIIFIVVIFYLLIYRPMRKRQKSMESMIASLKSGDKVITNGGMYGTIAAVKEHTFLLKIADQVKVEISKNAIASLQSVPKDSSGK